MLISDSHRGKCDATLPYREIGSDSAKDGGELNKLAFVKELESYMCFTEIEELKTFVRLARMRVTAAAAGQVEKA